MLDKLKVISLEDNEDPNDFNTVNLVLEPSLSDKTNLYFSICNYALEKLPSYDRWPADKKRKIMLEFQQWLKENNIHFYEYIHVYFDQIRVI